MKRLLASLILLATGAAAQELDPAKLLKLPTDTWPTYNGDYSGRRFSPLTQINAANVNAMTLAWVWRVRNVGAGEFSTEIKATPLEVNGVLYFAVPDHAWAVDARTGRELWHYTWETKGGIHIGNRGFGMYGNWLYFETPDNYLVCLNASDGKERWNVEIADVKQEYFSTPAPVVIRNHVIVGVGGDSLDVPGFLESRDPETGKVQWHWNTTPRKGEPGAETWPNKDAMEHGGGMTWMPGTYDPELNLYYLGTGNPNPVMAGQGRKGNQSVDVFHRGAESRYRQAGLVFPALPARHPRLGCRANAGADRRSDQRQAAQTPRAGQPQRLLLPARSHQRQELGHRSPSSISTGRKAWTPKASRSPIPTKEPKTDGTLVIPGSGGATNWPAPSFDPETGLLYVNTTTSYSMFYLTDTDARPEGYGGRDAPLWSTTALKAIDYQTGQVKWNHPYSGQGSGLAGILSTAGKVVFTGDATANFVAFDATSGKPLWHSRLGTPVSNGPITFELDGRQYVVVGAGDQLFGFVMQAR